MIFGWLTILAVILRYDNLLIYCQALVETHVGMGKNSKLLVLSELRIEQGPWNCGYKTTRLLNAPLFHQTSTEKVLKEWPFGPTCKASFLRNLEFTNNLKTWIHAVICGGAELYSNVDVMQDSVCSDDVD